jgi:hypothetical protein
MGYCTGDAIPSASIRGSGPGPWCRPGRDTSGGQSGTGTLGGKGAWAHGEFSLTAGTVLRIAVGQQGENDPFSRSAGGGGASFVMKGTTPLVVAGGGGGGGSSTGQAGKDASSSGKGNGSSVNSAGGSWKMSVRAASAPISLGNGMCTGATTPSGCGAGGTKKDCSGGSGGDGGFGGAGAGTCSTSRAGSGGGYTAGNGANPAPGGTSYIDTTAIKSGSVNSASGVQSGNGKVIISW